MTDSRSRFDPQKRRHLPVVFVLFSLVTLAILPVLTDLRTDRIRAEIRERLEPMRADADRALFALLREQSALIGLQVTDQRHYRDLYLEAQGEREESLRNLEKSLDLFGPETVGAYEAFQTALNRWESEVRRRDLLTEAHPSSIFMTELFEMHPLFEEPQVAAEELKHALNGEIEVRRAEIESIGRQNTYLTVLLALLALAAALTVAWLARRMQYLAGEAMQRREEAEREAGSAREAREVAEQERKRATFLAGVSRAFSESLDREQVLGKIGELAVPAIADVVWIDWFSDEKSAERVVVVHHNPELRDLVAQLSPAVLTEPVRPGAPVLLRTRTEILNELDTTREPDRDRLRRLQLQSMIIVPLVARGRMRGVLVLASDRPDRIYDQSDLHLAGNFGSRAALAADNATLYQESQLAVQARDEILAVVSHDLRNPLTSISMASSMIASTEVPDDVREPVRTIELSVRQMSRLIQDLLDVSTMEAGRTLSIEQIDLDLSALLHELSDLFSPQIENAELRLETAVSPDLPLVYGDRDRLAQAIGNLVGNAIKFTPAGGTITVRAEKVDDAVEVSVSDTGSGIPADEVPRVFDRFWQARRTRRLGAGLGLAIAKGIVEAHGGEIVVESRQGEGTTFRLTIPLAPKTVAPVS